MIVNNLVETFIVSNTSIKINTLYKLLLLVSIFGIVIGTSSAQVAVIPEDHCQLSLPVLGEDVTPLVYEAYEVYQTNPDRHAEIRKTILVKLGQQVDYYGLHAVGGSWVFISEWTNGYYLQIGDDWTVGEDGQLHSPRCVMIAPLLPDEIFNHATNLIDISELVQIHTVLADQFSIPMGLMIDYDNIARPTMFN